MNRKFPIAEIFDSIDGEGKRTGYMAIFVRFAGCNLRCSYCDTGYALEERGASEYLSQEELLARIHAYPWKNITLTGGEPLLQPLQSLCDSLSGEGYDINIETNGAVPLLSRRPEHLFYTMDYKCPGSGEEQAMLPENLRLLTEQDVLKFVVESTADLERMKDIIQTRFAGREVLFYVSPVWGKIAPVELVEYVKQHGLGNVCVQVQLHKIIWDPQKRGV